VKTLGLVSVFCASVALVACGEGGSSSESKHSEKLAKPEVEPPPGPPPKELVVKDLVKGSGPGAEPGDVLRIHYVGVDRAGKELYTSWGRGFGPLTYALGEDAYNFQGLDEGLEGMKAGGRRELLIPANLAFGEPLFYVIDLLKVE
jgi:peptidylprolyl isomerase